MNITEASNMSEGTYFNLKIECYYSYDDACRIRDNTKLVVIKVRDGFKFPEYNVLEPITTTLLNADFIPIQKPVTFEEVFKSDKLCKIECKNLYRNEKYYSEYHSLEDLLHELTEDYSNIKPILREANWYLQEEN